LARILNSQPFRKAPSLSRLLTHIVEHSFDAPDHPLNEYSLGVDVFHRGSSFDPATDTIVRVQARRLRSKLENYYAAAGQEDPIRIELPKGQYAAVPRAVDSNGDASAPGPPSRLPVPCTTLIGRDEETAEILRLLGDHTVRLLTLTGAGGSGKTRLAFRAAADCESRFEGGIYLAELASVSDPGTVASTIAHTIGLRHTGGRPLAEALPLYLRDAVHAPTLLLLDNFEQVLGAAPLLPSLLANCPLLKILVTSREVLRVSGEREYPVPPLAAPNPNELPPFDQLSRNPALELFVQRALAVNPAFALTPDNAPVIARICSRLDGLPLAIELAAARAKVLSPEALFARLENSLDLLTSGPRDVPARQQTLRGTIDWSHELLGPAERKLFRRLAVFSGGCTLESAEAVCNPRRDLEMTVLDGISSLLDKSLLQRKAQGNREIRFVMLETVRSYAREQLSKSGEEEHTRRALAAYSIVLAEEGAAQISEEARSEWLAIWGAEHDNLRAALDWLIEIDSGKWALRLATALFPFWERREHLAEGRERLEAVLNLKSAASTTPERARAAWYAGALADKQGDTLNSARIHRESLEVYRALGDRKGVAAQLQNIGHELYRAGDMAAARPVFEESLAVCKELGDRYAIARALSNYAEFAKADGQYGLARSLLQEALSLFRELENESGIGWALNHLGDVAFDEEDWAKADRDYNEGLEVFRKAGDQWGMARTFLDLGRLRSEQKRQIEARELLEQGLRAFLELRHQRGIAGVLEGLACVSVRQGDPDRALTLSGAAEGLRRRVGAPQRPSDRAKFDRILGLAWGNGDPAIAKASWTEGLRMPLEHAIRYALERPPATRSSSARN
jgi:predicted ATPase